MGVVMVAVMVAVMVVVTEVVREGMAVTGITLHTTATPQVSIQINMIIRTLLTPRSTTVQILSRLITQPIPGKLIQTTIKQHSPALTT